MSLTKQDEIERFLGCLRGANTADRGTKFRKALFEVLTQIWDEVEDEVHRIGAIIFADISSLFLLYCPHKPSKKEVCIVEKHIIFFPDILCDEPESEIKHTIAHEFAHFMLGHEELTNCEEHEKGERAAFGESGLACGRNGISEQPGRAREGGKKMRRIAVVAVLVILLISSGRAFAFQNEPDGFRGLKWGDPPGEEMEFLQDFMETAVYENPGEEQKLGAAKFYSILYGFYISPNTATKQFMTVALYFRGKENFGILETICKAKFGEPTEKGYQEFNWISLTSTVVLTYDGIEQTGYLSLESSRILHQYTEERKKRQAEEAEEDW